MWRPNEAAGIRELRSKEDDLIPECLAFDDVLLVPRKSSVLPRECQTSTRFSRGIALNLPLVGAAMDTVTEGGMAIALAQCGGIGVIHKNLTIEEQVREVVRVKRAESGMIVDPITMKPANRLRDAVDAMTRHGVSGVPIVDGAGRLVGIVTKRDILFENDLEQLVSEKMTRVPLVTAPVGTTLEQAQKILKRHKIEKLPIVDRDGKLRGLITVKDILKKLEHPDATLDRFGRLRCAAAVGVAKDALARAEALVDADVDALVIDTAHAQSSGVLKTARQLRARFPKTQLVAGNVAVPEAVTELIGLDLDAVKVGVGPGSICTTRVVAGVGVPQLTAIRTCSGPARKAGIPIIADGGIRFSGDIVKALAGGADSVMIGNLFAGTEESPGEEVLLEGRRYKIYRAMGSIDAMRRGSADRYFQEEAKKLVPEGIEGRVPFRGKVGDVVFQLIGGLRSGMGYCGAKNLAELRRRTRFVRITSAGLRESHPHDIAITKEAPNYEPPAR
jgi:IMP dehydrogenase